MSKQVDEALPVLAEDISPVSYSKDLLALREFVLDKLNTPRPNIDLIYNHLDKLGELIDRLFANAPREYASGLYSLKAGLNEIFKELLITQKINTAFLQIGLETLRTINAIEIQREAEALAALNIVPDPLIDVTPLQSEEQAQMSIAQKEGNPQLVISEPLDLGSLSLASNVGEEVLVEVLGGHEDVLDVHL
jgi:hypothetical protein